MKALRRQGVENQKKKKQLPVSKTEELKIPKDGKRCHYMGSLRDRVKIKETIKHGLG